MRRQLLVLLAILLVTPLLQSPVATPTSPDRTLVLRNPVSVTAVAVSQTSNGLVGTTAKVEATVADNGSGHVFMDTVPLAQVDMQGSARLASRVAAGLVGVPQNRFDYFYIIRSNSTIIGGPSAGGIMTVATVAALEGWSVDPRVFMTGTVNPDGSVGPVGGIPDKVQAAWRAGAQLFLFPEGQSKVTADNGTVLNLPTYCARAFGITCRPVSDVASAVQAFTGHAFVEPTPPGNVTTPSYRATMAPLAAELLAHANKTLRTAEGAYANRTGSDVSTDQQLQRSLAAARADRDAGLQAEAKGLYYTTASRAFQSSIESGGVTLAVGYLRSSNPSGYWTNQVNRVQDHVDAVGKAAGRVTARGLAQLEAVAAAQTRAIEAQNRLDSARAAYANGTGTSAAINALSDVAYADERASTVTWWLQMGETYATGGPLNQTRLQETRRDVFATSQETLAYAKLLLQEEGVPASALSSAYQLQASAQTALQRGFLGAAIFDSLQAETRASVALSIVGLDPAAMGVRVNTSAEAAAVAIQGSRDLGVEPILAVAYYEFAGNLTPASEQLVFYDSAKVIAKATSTLLGAPPTARPSRFVGPDQAVLAPVVRATDVVGIFALALALGAGLALTATSPSKKRSRGGGGPGGSP